LLLPDRSSVFALWTVPCAWKARYVCGTYRSISWKSGGVGLCTVRGACFWCYGNLVVCADRLVFGRCAGDSLLSGKTEDLIDGTRDRGFGCRSMTRRSDAEVQN